MDAVFALAPNVGWSGVGVLVLAWLVVSFSEPGPRRAIFEWLGALGLYVGLVSLFTHLLGRMIAGDNLVGMIAFGFLVLFFGTGLVLCLVQTALSLRGPREAASSATN